MDKQRTLRKKVVLSGIGVHTGSKSTMTFLPAEAGTGIHFVRMDMAGTPIVPAHIDNVVDTARGTILGKGEAKIFTGEHVMAALWAYGVTNVRIELSDKEPPSGDGSSKPFVEMLEEAGLEEQGEPYRCVKAKKAFTVREGDALISLLPYDGFKISYTLAFDHPIVSTQYVSLDLDRETFKNSISNCRTFCFYREVESLMDQGLIQGGSLDNAIVIDDQAILSKEGLRFDDEFARHKILDLLGDLYLLNSRVEGHIVAIKSGHSLNVKFTQTLNQQFYSYEKPALIH